MCNYEKLLSWYNIKIFVINTVQLRISWVFSRGVGWCVNTALARKRALKFIIDIRIVHIPFCGIVNLQMGWGNGILFASVQTLRGKPTSYTVPPQLKARNNRKDQIGYNLENDTENAINKYKIITLQVLVAVRTTLGDVNADRRAEIEQCANDVEETDNKHDSYFSVFEAFHTSGGSDDIVLMTNFSVPEFNRVWDEISSFVNSHWNFSLEIRCELQNKDVLSMIQTVFKHGGQRNFLACMFKIRTLNLIAWLWRLIHILAENIYSSWVFAIAERYTIAHMFDMKNLSRHHSFYRYAVDVLLHQVNTPSGNVGETKFYYAA